jgi:hypothetical protein
MMKEYPMALQKEQPTQRVMMKEYPMAFQKEQPTQRVITMEQSTQRASWTPRVSLRVCSKAKMMD